MCTIIEFCRDYNWSILAYELPYQFNPIIIRSWPFVYCPNFKWLFIDFTC